MKVFITGGGGLLGQYLNLSLSRDFQILTMFHKRAGNATLFNNVKGDVRDFKFVKSILDDFKPDVIIHNAAISNAELADKAGREVTMAVNVSATEKLAELNEKLNSVFIFNSTDLVYAESKGKLLTENSPLNPVSLYAESKALAEEKIKLKTGKYLILRNALMYGFGLNHSRNHFHNVFEKLKNSESVKLFTDQFRTPLELADAANLINLLIKKRVWGKTLNFGGVEKVSRFELGLAVCKVFGFNESLLQPTLLKDAPVKYKVADVSMDVTELLLLGLHPQKIKEALKKLKNKK